MPTTLPHFNQNRMASTKLSLTRRNSVFYKTKLALQFCGPPLRHYRVLKVFTSKDTCISIGTLNHAFHWAHAKQLCRLKKCLSLIKGGEVSYSQIWNRKLLVSSKNMSMFMLLTISAVYLQGKNFMHQKWYFKFTTAVWKFYRFYEDNCNLQLNHHTCPWITHTHTHTQYVQIS